MSARALLKLTAWTCLAGVFGCSPDREVGPAIHPPSVSHVAATKNPLNALSTVVTFQSAHADSARIIYWIDGNASETTPYGTVADSSNRMVVLGLRPTTLYNYAVEVVGGGVIARSTPIKLATGELPQFLQGVRIAITTGTPPPGYVLTSVSDGDTIGYVVAFEPSGAIAWYREFEYGVPSRETKQQANGNFTVFLGSSLGGPAYGWYVEFTPDGTIVRTYAANPPYYTDLHELLLTFTDTTLDRALFFAYDIRRVDLSPIGGPANAQVGGHLLLRQTAAGGVDFFWSAWDHFALEDWIEEPAFLRQASQGNDFDHPNSLDIDHDGNYLVSWRNFAEVTKIDSRNGNIIWRLGGTHNQFTFLNDPLGGFSGQHTVGALENGDLLLFDNGWRHTPSESRVAQYRLDLNAKTATLVWEFRHNPPIFAGFAGSAQRLSSGNTFIGWVFAGTVTEVTAAGSVLWEGQLLSGGQPPFFYRAVKIPSLYEFRIP